MVEYDLLKKGVIEFVNALKDIHGSIRILYRNNVDAICGATILVKNLESKKISVINFNLINNERIGELEKYNDDAYIFIDVSSRSINNIKERLQNKKIFLISRANVNFYEGIFVINPFIQLKESNDPRSQISISGLCYLVAKNYNEQNRKLSYLVQVGLLGDNIRREGLSEIEKEIIDDAILTKTIEIKKGIKLSLNYTTAVYKALANSISLFLFGISGNEQNALDFLQEKGFKFDSNKRLIDLSEEELRKLMNYIVEQSFGNREYTQEIEDIYLIKARGYREEFEDAIEVVRLIEACIALNKPSLAIAFCLNPEGNYNKAITVLKQYRRELIEAFDWFSKNQKKEFVQEKEKYVMIYAKEKLLQRISIDFMRLISKNLIFTKGKLIILIIYGQLNDVDILFTISGDREGRLLRIDELIDNLTKPLIKQEKDLRNLRILSLNLEDEEELLKRILEKLNTLENVENIE